MTGITAPTTVEAAMLSRRLLLLPDQGQVPGDLAEMIRGRRILLDPPAIHGVYGERRERASSPQCNSRPSWTKKFSDVVTNLLTADVLNVHSFSAWWKQTKQSNDFWVETHRPCTGFTSLLGEPSSIQINGGPRTSIRKIVSLLHSGMLEVRGRWHALIFVGWNLFMTCGSTERISRMMSFGSEEVCIAKSLSPWQARKGSSTTPLGRPESYVRYSKNNGKLRRRRARCKACRQ